MPTSGSTAGTSSSRSRSSTTSSDGEELVLEPFQRLIEMKSSRVQLRRILGCMDTFKEKQLLDDMYAEGKPPGKYGKMCPLRCSRRRRGTLQPTAQT